MLLQKIARNHPEDTVSDIIWYICKRDYNFAEKLLSPFISLLNDFTIVDIVRNYIISDGYMPDLTFLLSHKKTNKLIYIIIETKISSTQNIHKINNRTKKQYSVYKDYLNKKNKETNLQIKYNIIDKCILLCPSYYDDKDDENSLIHLRFLELLKLLGDSENNDTEGIRTELIKYIKEEFEGTCADLNENIGILEHKIELKSAQNHILALRDTMLKEKGISKTGLWQASSECYCYFGIGLRTKYTPKKEEKSWKHRSWLSYDFFYDEDIYSPIKLSFPKKIIKKGIIHVAKYRNKHNLCCDLLTESQINDNFIEIFNSIHCSDRLKDNIIAFTNYYKNPNKKIYLVKFNEFLSSILNYIDRFSGEVSKEYDHNYFDHSLNQKEMLLRLNTKTRSNGKHFISIIAEPTCYDIDNILRMEIFKDSELIRTIKLIDATKTGYKVKYDLTTLKDEISNIFNSLYEA